MIPCKSDATLSPGRPISAVAAVDEQHRSLSVRVRGAAAPEDEPASFRVDVDRSLAE